LVGCSNQDASIFLSEHIVNLPQYRESEILGNDFTDSIDLWDYSFIYAVSELNDYTVNSLSIPSPSDLQNKLLLINPNAYVVVWRTEEITDYYIEYEYYCRIDTNAITQDELRDVLDTITISITLTKGKETEQTFETKLGDLSED